MYQVYNKKILDVFLSMFHLNSSIHNHYTRQSGLLHPPLPKIELSKSNIDYRGVLIWNKIMSLEIRLDKSKSIFCEDLNNPSHCIVALLSDLLRPPGRD